MARLFTVGHSNRTAQELLELLEEHEVKLLVDVRRFPASRRHPQFSQKDLAAALELAGIRYFHEEDLGGYRTPAPDSPNTAWRKAGFRGYADHLASPAFGAALERLVTEAHRSTTALLCAEALPWRCHRQLIADALVAAGHEVVHILDRERVEPHRLNEQARVLDDGRLVYPAGEGPQMDLFPAPTRS